MSVWQGLVVRSFWSVMGLLGGASILSPHYSPYYHVGERSNFNSSRSQCHVLCGPTSACLDNPGFIQVSKCNRVYALELTFWCVCFPCFHNLKHTEVKKQIICLPPTPLFNHIPESFHVLGVPFKWTNLDKSIPKYKQPYFFLVLVWNWFLFQEKRKQLGIIQMKRRKLSAFLISSSKMRQIPYNHLFNALHYHINTNLDMLLS